MILNYTEYKKEKGAWLQTMLEKTTENIYKGEFGSLRLYLEYLSFYKIPEITKSAIRVYMNRCIPYTAVGHNNNFCPSVLENIDDIINYIHKKYI